MYIYIYIIHDVYTIQPRRGQAGPGRPPPLPTRDCSPSLGALAGLAQDANEVADLAPLVPERRHAQAVAELLPALPVVGQDRPSLLVAQELGHQGGHGEPVRRGALEQPGEGPAQALRPGMESIDCIFDFWGRGTAARASESEERREEERRGEGRREMWEDQEHGDYAGGGRIAFGGANLRKKKKRCACGRQPPGTSHSPTVTAKLLPRPVDVDD